MGQPPLGQRALPCVYCCGLSTFPPRVRLYSKSYLRADSRCHVKLQCTTPKAVDRELYQDPAHVPFTFESAPMVEEAPFTAVHLLVELTPVPK